ncbi:hypothetical protein AMECASPLE_003155 [Ameca splendens]|uniref:Uncharacterized protein n=1 Tax=Ameca splendens TaxID=208324 RepID=A0ABV0Z7T6_9TELE
MQGRCLSVTQPTDNLRLFLPPSPPRCFSCASPQNAQVPQFQQGSVWICSTEPQEVLATSRTRHTGKLVQV